jgi:hypothetical protein
MKCTKIFRVISPSIFSWLIVNTNTVWIVFQRQYEVFRHLIKDNKYENNKINKLHRQVRFSWLHLIFMSLIFIKQKQKFSGKNYKSVAALSVIVFLYLDGVNFLLAICK